MKSQLQPWKHTTGAAPPAGSCGTCMWIRRDEAAYHNESRFYCGMAPQLLRVKARSKPPAKCPSTGKPQRDAKWAEVTA